MSTPPSQPSDPRPLSDEEILHAHEAHRDEPDDGGHFRLLPLVLLFTFSALILFAGTYVADFAGKFSPLVHDERAHPVSGVITVQIDPIVLGETLFKANCASCHMETGLGMAGAIPPLAGSEWVMGNPERIIRVVLKGLTGPVTIAGNDFGLAPMPAVAEAANLRDDQISAILTYVRQAWGNTAGPVATEEITEARAAISARTTPWTAAELQQFE